MKCDILTGLVLIKMKWLAEQFSRSLLLLSLLGNITDDLTGLKHFETGPISFQQSLKYKSNNIICTSRNIQKTRTVGGYIIIYCSRAKIWLFSKSCYSDKDLFGTTYSLLQRFFLQWLSLELLGGRLCSLLFSFSVDTWLPNTFLCFYTQNALMGDGISFRSFGGFKAALLVCIQSNFLSAFLVSSNKKLQQAIVQ